MRYALVRHLFLATLIIGVSGRLQPAVADTCGVTGTTSASIGTYNPFSATGFHDVSVTLTLTRFAETASAKTKSVNFYLIEPGGLSALQIRYRGYDILHSPARAPYLSLASPASGTVYYHFGSAHEPDTVSLHLTVSVPAGIDLSAGRALAFDLIYVCDAVGGMDRVVFPMVLNQALMIRIDVASALQASWAGPALHFGEIGDLGDFAALTLSAEGAVRVASSGPYMISVSSANGYRMTYPGGHTDVPTQRVNYVASFLGRVASPQLPVPMLALCRRAGLAGKNLPLRVRLLEGGSDKVAAPDYKDTLTVTVTPLAASYTGSVEDCP